MIITSAGKRNLQSTSRQNDLLFCLMISSWGVYATKCFFFISTSYPPSSEAWASSYFSLSFFCLLPFHIAVWRPSLHLHPTAWRHIWLLNGQMMRAVNHCGNACSVRLLVSFFFSPASGWLDVCHTASGSSRPVLLGGPRWGQCLIRGAR